MGTFCYAFTLDSNVLPSLLDAPVDSLQYYNNLIKGKTFYKLIKKYYYGIVEYRRKYI